MKDHIHCVIDELEELIEEPELIEHSHHKKAERIYLWARNICVGIATVLFLLSFIFHGCHELLRGVAYLFGAVGYFSELGVLTDNFNRRVPHEELFMIYCFGPLYILMGLAYLLE